MAYGRWLFFVFRIKQNAGEIFDRLLDWTSSTKDKNPDGNYFEQARLAGGAIHSRRLWRIEGLKFSGYPGVTEAFVIDKTNLDTQHIETQYFISSYPSSNWNAENIINRILLHWDTETGTFGTKDHHFSEDKVRYKSIQGAKSHVMMLNSICNLFWAPALENYWWNMPISYRMQFFKDHPEYNPFQLNNID